MVAVDKQQILNNQAEQNQIAVMNPVTGEQIGTISVMDTQVVGEAASRGCAAQPNWEARGVRDRAKLVQKWADMLWADQKNAIDIIRSETGKTTTGAWQEVSVLDNVVHYYTQNAARFLRPQTRRSLLPGKQKARVHFKPYGLCGFITPWNYPLNNGFIDLIPALIAGNAILVKPSEVTPLTARYVVDLMVKAGIPKDVIQIVTGDGSTGSALLDVVDYISFTGSTAVGRKVAMRAAERLIPCSLELGGKDPMIVLGDANIDLAASGALTSALENAGQVCISTERIYVENAVYDSFVERIRHHASRLILDKRDGFDVHVGSLTNEREIQRTEAHIQDAVGKGAEVIYGGKKRPDLGPLFFEPTILVNVNHDMAMMREETFGPLVPIMNVKDVDEAIRLANDSEYGLSASIFTSDLRRGEQLATRLESGDVGVNCAQWVFGTPSLPMGGVKNSGLGRRNGPEGILRFVRPQSVLIDNQLMDAPKLVQADARTISLYGWIRKARKLLPFLPI